jgi:hypothetical protein
MIDEIIFIYSFCHDLLRELGFVDDNQCKMNAAEIMTVAFVGALYFQGNHALAMRFLKDHLYVVHMLSKSRFNRRVHAIDFDFWQIIFSALKTALVQTKKDFEYVVDSFPVEACHTARSYRCKILRGKGFIGYCAAKKKYYYGVKVHMITTTLGAPVEFLITPASIADITALKAMQIDVRFGAVLYGDKAYTDYSFEDMLRDSMGVRLIPERKSCLRRQHSGPLGYLQSVCRKRIETVFSQITRIFPKSVRAVTRRGFILRILLFVIAYTLMVVHKDSALAKTC